MRFPWLLDVAIADTARDLAYDRWPVAWESLSDAQRDAAMAEAAAIEEARADR
jgi:hypothetical protein